MTSPTERSDEDLHREHIQVLESEVTKADHDLRVARNRLATAVIAYAPFKVGDVVIASRRWDAAGARPAIVRSVRKHSWKSIPAYQVSYARKSGGWQDRTYEVDVVWATEV